MIDAVKRLFVEYEKAFNALDVEKQVPFFTEHFISAGPKGNIARGRDESLKWRQKLRNFIGGSVRHPQKFFLWMKSR